MSQLQCISPLSLFKPNIIYLCLGESKVEFGEYSIERLAELSEQVSINAYLVAKDESGNLIDAMFGKLEPWKPNPRCMSYPESNVR